jgi:hypothetical protein
MFFRRFSSNKRVWLLSLPSNTREGYFFEELVCVMKCFITSTMLPLLIHTERVSTPNVSGWVSLSMNCFEWTQRSTITGGNVLPAALMKQHVWLPRCSPQYFLFDSLVSPLYLHNFLWIVQQWSIQFLREPIDEWH